LSSISDVSGGRYYFRFNSGQAKEVIMEVYASQIAILESPTQQRHPQKDVVLGFPWICKHTEETYYRK